LDSGFDFSAEADVPLPDEPLAGADVEAAFSPLTEAAPLDESPEAEALSAFCGEAGFALVPVLPLSVT